MPTKQSEYSKSYRKAHPGKAKASSQKYYLRLRDERRVARIMRGATLCRCCGRELKDEESQMRGKGDRCESGNCACKHAEKAPKASEKVA